MAQDEALVDELICRQLCPDGGLDFWGTEAPYLISCRQVTENYYKLWAINVTGSIRVPT